MTSILLVTRVKTVEVDWSKFDQNGLMLTIERDINRLLTEIGANPISVVVASNFSPNNDGTIYPVILNFKVNNIDCPLLIKMLIAMGNVHTYQHQPFPAVQLSYEPISIAQEIDLARCVAMISGPK